MTSRTNAPSWPPFCCRLQKQRVKSPLLWFYRKREKHRMNHFSLLCDFKMKREVKIPAAVFVNVRIVVALISSLFRTVILYSCWFGFPVAQKPAMSSVVTVRTFLILMAAMFVALISSLFRTVILYSCWFGFPVAQEPAMPSVVTVRTF